MTTNKMSSYIMYYNLISYVSDILKNNTSAGRKSPLSILTFLPFMANYLLSSSNLKSNSIGQYDLNTEREDAQHRVKCSRSSG